MVDSSPPPDRVGAPEIGSGPDDRAASASAAASVAGSGSRAWRGVAAVAAVPVGLSVGCVAGLVSWWQFRKLFSPAGAAGFGLTLAVLVVATGVLVAVLPAGRVRRHVLAGLPAVWLVLVGGVWWGRLYLGGLGGWLVAVLGLVVVGGGLQAWVWWDTHARRHTWVLAGVTGVLLLLVPVSAGYWVWNMSAHFGTAGEPSPKAAVRSWFGAMFPGGPGGPSGGLDRLVCEAPASGRASMLSVQRQWTRWERRSGSWMSVDWYPERVTVTGDRAHVAGTVSMQQATTGATTWLQSPSTRWTFTLVRSDGWRLCGVSFR